MPSNATNRRLQYLEFVHREQGIRHQSAEEDTLPIELIKAGDPRAVDAMRELGKNTRASHCSDDPLRNAKYLFVAGVTLAGRAAISVGMDAERSNIASDLFIQRADRMTSIDALNDLTLEMTQFYVDEVASLERQSAYSLPVTRALDYIYYHLHEPLTVEMVADHLSLSRSYFSTLFKSEMGIGVAAYILRKKMEAARGMLRYTDMPYAEISQVLAFSSQSHFSQVFKKMHGVTPREYRSQ